MTAIAPKICKTSCPPGVRLYVAVSEDLVRRVLKGDPRVRDGKPQVFKVGTTEQLCAGRKITLDQKIVDGVRPQGYGRTSAYAGTQDWEFLQCHAVPHMAYDRKNFRKWVQNSQGVKWSKRGNGFGVSWLSKLEFIGTVSGRWTGVEDLYAMSEELVWGDGSALQPHPYYTDLLVAAAAKLRSLLPKASSPTEPDATS